MSSPGASEPRWDLEALHRRSLDNRAALAESDRAGCFQCLRIFPAGFVVRWVQPRRRKDDALDCGLCPFCNTDAILPSAGLELSNELLTAMRRRWFDQHVSLPVDCQQCGDRVPVERWHGHLAEHQDNRRPVLPVATAYEKHASAPPNVETPLRSVPVRLWVTSITLLEELRLDKLPNFDAPFVHEGVTYQIQSMQLTDAVDIVLNTGSSAPRPLTTSEVELARAIPTDHSCNSRCLRCMALRTGQL